MSSFCPIFFFSATLSGVDTLKYSPFHEIFSFFNLVRDLFSKWNFSKKVLSIDDKVLIYLHFWHENYKSYFFMTEI